MVTMPDFGSVPGYTVGRIAIYNRSISGQWRRTGTFEPGPNEGFGSTIVLKEGTALIPRNGGIHVYRLKRGVWTDTATLTLPISDRPSTFGGGESIKYDNGTVIVSAFYTDDFTSFLLVYRLNAAGEVIGRNQIFASDSEPVRSLGWQGDVQGDTIVAAGNTANQGAVYVFQRSGNQWIQTQKITRPISDPFNTFPSALALNRGVLLIGDSWARFESADETSDGHSAAGVVHVYARENGSFSYRTQLRPTPHQLFQYYGFGSRIVTDGDRAVISTYEPPSYLYANGVAVLYERHGDEAVATRIARFDDVFATSLSGDRLLLGSPYFVDYTDNSFHLIGWADFYTLPPVATQH
jgi:hypothetical protein